MKIVEIYSRQLMLGLQQFEDSRVKIEELLGELGQPSRRHKRFGAHTLLKPVVRGIGTVVADAFGFVTKAKIDNLNKIQQDLYQNRIKLHTTLSSSERSMLLT